MPNDQEFQDEGFCEEDIFTAIETSNHLLLLQLLREPAYDVNEKNSQGLTPLLLAVTQGRRWVVEQLLKAQADHDIPDSNGIYCIHHAIINHHEDIAKLLVNYGANIHREALRPGGDALFFACSSSSDRFIHFLLLCGAKITTRHYNRLKLFNRTRSLTRL